jgi:hypothetical protein
MEMQTEPTDFYLDSQDALVSLPDGDRRRATPLEVPVVLFLDLPLIHDLVASALHAASPQGCFPGADFALVLKATSKRFPAPSIC